MKDEYLDFPSYFFTATIYEWKPLLASDKHKDIIVESLQFLVNDKRIQLNAFVIMNNHIHIILQPLSGFAPSATQASFMKYTAQQLKRSILETDKVLLETFKVNKYDRDYQIWKRTPLSVDLLTKELFVQKLEYIHYNPVKAGLCRLPEEYYYSSAKFYVDGNDSFGMLTHFSGN